MLAIDFFLLDCRVLRWINEEKGKREGRRGKGAQQLLIWIVQYLSFPELHALSADYICL